MPGSNPSNDILHAIQALESTITQMHPISTTQPVQPAINDLLLGINSYKSLFLPEYDTEVVTDTLPGIKYLSPSSESHSHSSNNLTHNNQHTKHIIKVITHKGHLNSTKKPLMFLVRFPAVLSKYDRWFPFITLNNNTHLNKYVNKHPHLWPEINNIQKVPSQVNHNNKTTSYFIKHIFQHRKDPDSLHNYLLKVRYDDVRKSDEWISINEYDNNDKCITSSPVFKSYISKTQDINFFRKYITSSFDDKIMMANSAAILTSDNLSSNHHGLKYLDKGKPLRYLKAIQSNDAEIWKAKHSDELDRLINRRKILRFIAEEEKDFGRIASYWNPQLTKPIKNGIPDHRVRGCYGGNINDYDGPTTAYTASLPTVKILLNAVVSDPNSKFMTLDIGDFFLYGSSGRKEYMRIPLSHFTQEDMIKYDINKFIKPNAKTVLTEVNGNLYGLVNASLVAQKNLIELLNQNDFYETDTAQLYKHKFKNIEFTLIVDDFGVKYNDKVDAEFLHHILLSRYEKVKVDWSGELYLGMSIKLDRNSTQHSISLSMPGYIPRLLQRLDLGPYKTNTNTPTPYQQPQYGQKVQYINEDDTKLIDDDRIHKIKQGVGSILYYQQAVAYDFTTSVTKLSSKQAKPTEKVWNDFLHLLNYANTWSESILTFYPSDMKLVLDGDVSYLSEDKSRSRGGGIAYLGKTKFSTFINGAIDVMSVILPTVVASACEGEYASSFLIAQKAMPFLTTLNALGYPQSKTLLTTDNKCAEGIANKSIKLKRSRAIDMRYHWIRDKVDQGMFDVKWRRNTQSLADFFTKTLPNKEFLNMRKIFVTHKFSK